jgi:hypothetical protein
MLLGMLPVSLLLEKSLRVHVAGRGGQRPGRETTSNTSQKSITKPNALSARNGQPLAGR